MDIKKIQELVKLITKTNIGEISIEEKDFKITIKQKRDAAQHFTAPQFQQAPQQLPQPVAPKTEKPKEEAAPKADNLLNIKSPIIGTF